MRGAELAAVRLLPLCGLVAFPHTPKLHVSSTMAIEEPTTVGLLRVSAGGTLASVGTLAKASPVCSGSRVLACEPFGRFSRDDASTADAVYALEDVPPLATDEEAQLFAAVWENLEALSKLSGEALPPHLYELRPGDGRSASTFSLALAGTLGLEFVTAGQLLEGTDSTERLRRLQEVIEEDLAYARVQAAMRSLGG